MSVDRIALLSEGVDQDSGGQSGQKCLQDVVDEQFQLTGKRFCIDFFENGGPKQYLSLEKNMEPIGES